MIITTTHTTYRASTHDQAVIRALNSITSKQADIIASIARAGVHEWEVQTVDDYDGYRFVLIESVTHSDEQKSFFIAGTAQCLELFEGKDDNLALIGTFSDMKAFEAQLTELVRLQ